MGGFTFKHFHVDHDLCAMKVGTDGTLLGAWAKAEVNMGDNAEVNVGDNAEVNVGNNAEIEDEGGERMSILDIGCGSGLISLILAQRYTNAHITAIDIDEGAVRQTRINADNTPWHDRIEVVECAIQDFTSDVCFDLIVCNPPFFVSSLKCPDNQRTMARHADTLTLQQLMNHSSRLLSPTGQLAIIIPADMKGEADTAASLARMYCTRQCFVKTTPTKQPKRVMMSFSPSYHPFDDAAEPTVMHLGDEYFLKLTGEIYITKT